MLANTLSSSQAMSPPTAIGNSQRRSKLVVLFKWLLLVCLIGVLAFGMWFLLHLLLPRNYQASGATASIQVAGQPFEVLLYNGNAAAKGVVLVATGSGGWSYWEERVAKHLVAQGFAVAGWNCRDLADSRKYTQDDLARGFDASVNAAAKKASAVGKPVWYLGWSTGAEQALAAASSKLRSKNLRAVLVAAPGTRGRYGMTTSDLLGMTPTGEDTFALADLLPGIEPVPIVQFAAGLDPMDDKTWIQEYQGKKMLIELPNCMHDMGGAGDEFLADVDEAMKL